MPIFKINNVNMPVPALNGVSWSHEPVWSADAGRSASGKMLGSVIAYKWKFTVKWNALSYTEVQTVLNACSQNSADFKTVSITSPMNYNSVLSITAYCSAVSGTMYDWSNTPKQTELTLSIIEQ